MEKIYLGPLSNRFRDSKHARSYRKMLGSICEAEEELAKQLSPEHREMLTAYTAKCVKLCDLVAVQGFHFGYQTAMDTRGDLLHSPESGLEPELVATK